MKQDTKETIGSRGTVAGFRPLIGEERWHREDMPVWMLAGGLRPYLQGERLRRNDPAWNSMMGEEVVLGIAGEIPSKHPGWFFATDKPLPQPQIETFEAHGHVWYRHVPGEACPVEADVTVALKFMEGGYTTARASILRWSRSESYTIIGYRFPDFPAVHTTLQQQQPSAQPVIRGVGPYMAMKDVEKTMQSFQHDTTKQRLATMYHGWCDVAPDSVAECIADVARVLYPTDAERCDAAFERWWERSVGASGCKTTTRITWETAWSAAKQEKL